MKRGSPVRLLLRGLLGGALGGLIWVATPVVANLKQSGVPWDWLAVVYVLVGLPLGTVIGGLVAITLWLIHLQTRVVLGAILRLIIGTLTAMSLLGLLAWWQCNGPGYVKVSWQRNLIGIFLLGVATGGLSGLIIGTLRPEKEKLK